MRALLLAGIVALLAGCATADPQAPAASTLPVPEPCASAPGARATAEELYPCAKAYAANWDRAAVFVHLVGYQIAAAPFDGRAENWGFGFLAGDQAREWRILANGQVKAESLVDLGSARGRSYQAAIPIPSIETWRIGQAIAANATAAAFVAEFPEGSAEYEGDALGARILLTGSAGVLRADATLPAWSLAAVERQG